MRDCAHCGPLFPILGVAVGLYGVALDLNEAAVTLLGACGVFHLPANVTRELGKRREEALYREPAMNTLDIGRLYTHGESSAELWKEQAI